MLFEGSHEILENRLRNFIDYFLELRMQKFMNIPKYTYNTPFYQSEFIKDWKQHITVTDHDKFFNQDQNIKYCGNSKISMFEKKPIELLKSAFVKQITHNSDCVNLIQFQDQVRKRYIRTKIQIESAQIDQYLPL